MWLDFEGVVRVCHGFGHVDIGLSELCILYVFMHGLPCMSSCLGVFMLFCLIFLLCLCLGVWRVVDA